MRRKSAIPSPPPQHQEMICVLHKCNHYELHRTDEHYKPATQILWWEKHFCSYCHEYNRTFPKGTSEKIPPKLWRPVDPSDDYTF
jgi:hypothetical protein